MGVKRASPAELAEAMKHDHFFSSYRGSTLLVRGTVVSIHQTNGSVMVGLRTGSTFTLTRTEPRTRVSDSFEEDFFRWRQFPTDLPME
jgi:hypothetical protein